MTALVLVAVGAVAAPAAWALARTRAVRRVAACGLALLLVAAVVATALDGRAGGAAGDAATLLATVLAVAGGAVVTSAVLSWVGGDDETTSPAAAVLRGGTWIGVLERLAVVGTLAARWPEGAAVVVAVKGLGRYPELRAGDRRAGRADAGTTADDEAASSGVNERFIVGTLVSLVWAGACAYVGLAPLRLG